MAKVIAAVQNGSVARVTLLLSEPAPPMPIAPATLTRFEGEKPCPVFDLHRLVALREPECEFETYEPDQPLPQVGSEFELTSWWLPDQLEAVLDQTAEWERMAYPDNGDHEHCLLTYETIAAYAPHREGYRSSHGWITVEAYEEYIVRDRLRIRQVARPAGHGP